MGVEGVVILSFSKEISSDRLWSFALGLRLPRSALGRAANLGRCSGDVRRADWLLAGTVFSECLSVRRFCCVLMNRLALAHRPLSSLCTALLSFEASNFRLFAAALMYILGVCLMFGSDCQKYYQ